MRIDLHVHSKYSHRPSAWVLKKIGCPESFSEPMEIYRIAKRRGMDLVTISDHNQIRGALEIAHLPNTFVSEEITTYFPEDGCKLHVLALNITESQHEEIQKVRKNIFELVAYLRENQIFHVLAHALYAVNDRLSLDHFEKLLLLFRNFELNGSRNDEANVCLEQILNGLTQADIERLAEKHRIEPAFDKPWQKRLTGGSDDHSSLNIARTYTQTETGRTVADLIDAIRNGRVRVVRTPSSPRTMAHNLYSIAYQFYRSKFRLDRYTSRDPMMRFLNRSLSAGGETKEDGILSKLYFLWKYPRRSKSNAPMADTLIGLLRNETHKLLADSPKLKKIATSGIGNNRVDAEKLWFDFSNALTNQVLQGCGRHLIGQVTGARVFNIFQSIGSAGGLYTLLAPYFIAYSLFCRDRRFIQALEKRFELKNADPAKTGKDMRVAHFTDTFYEVNGVALTLQQQVAAAQKLQKQYTMITCDVKPDENRSGVVNFNPVGVYSLPEYPEQKLFLPPLLEMLDYCYNHGITQIHAATPGPVGLAALAIANILKLPISGTYHTQLPQYAQALTGDDVIQDLTWKYTLWYYGQMACIYAPSQATRKELIEKGISPEKIRCYPRGIDTERYHPKRRNQRLPRKYGIEDKIRLLYVGRVSKEKSLPLLADAFSRLAADQPNVQLVVVGEGPYLEEMQQVLAGKPCTFTGYLHGDDLSDIYAACDAFVFPSATDTFGNVVLEAQASGLPVIVTDQGGPAENVTVQTAIKIPADNASALLAAMIDLVKNNQKRTQMAAAARQYMEKRSFHGAFEQTWALLESEPAKIAV